MRTPVLITLIAACAAPAAAQDNRQVLLVRTSVEQATAQEKEQIERTVQQAEREAKAAIKMAKSAVKEAVREQDRERERIQREAERQRERAQRLREDRQRAAERRASGPEETERTTRTFKLGPDGELHLQNVSGDIVISRGSGNDAVVEIIKTARAATAEEARQLLSELQVDVQERGNRAEVHARFPMGPQGRGRGGRRGMHASVALNATVPAGTRVRVTSIAGSITSTDVKGELVLETVSGAVRVSNGGRVRSAKSISGTVEVVETDVDGPFDASSASGDIVLRKVKARQLDLGSISGSVTLDDVDCPQVEAQTVSGNVRFAGSLPRGARYDFTSHSGNVQLALAGGSGFEVEASSFSGSIRSDFPLKAESGSQGPVQRALRGVFGDGSAVFDLTTFSGDIVISKR